MGKASALEKDFEAQLLRYRLPPPQREYRFATAVERQHRFDFCWLEFMLAVEIQGFTTKHVEHRTTIMHGHGTPAQMIRDMDKNNMAILLGWSVLYFAERHIRNRDAIAVTHRALVVKGWNPPA